MIIQLFDIQIFNMLNSLRCVERERVRCFITYLEVSTASSSYKRLFSLNQQISAVNVRLIFTGKEDTDFLSRVLKTAGELNVLLICFNAEQGSVFWF